MLTLPADTLHPVYEGHDDSLQHRVVEVHVLPIQEALEVPLLNYKLACIVKLFEISIYSIQPYSEPEQHLNQVNGGDLPLDHQIMQAAASLTITPMLSLGGSIQNSSARSGDRILEHKSPGYEILGILIYELLKNFFIHITDKSCMAIVKKFVKSF